MIKAIISDFSRVILFPADKNYSSGLNPLHNQLAQQSNYNPLDHFKLNTELLDFYKHLRDKVQIYMFTSETIQDTPEFQPYLLPIFEKIFSAAKMGISKQNPESYRTIATQINLKPEEIVFIDDMETNIKVAKSIGMQAIQFKNNEQVKKDISILID